VIVIVGDEECVLAVGCVVVVGSVLFTVADCHSRPPELHKTKLGSTSGSSYLSLKEADEVLRLVFVERVEERTEPGLFSLV
jgi:hypothetical protein